MKTSEINKLERTTFHAAEAAIVARNKVATARFALKAATGAARESLLAAVTVHANLAEAAADVANAALAALHGSGADRATMLDAKDATDTADANAKSAARHAAAVTGPTYAPAW